MRSFSFLGFRRRVESSAGPTGRAAGVLPQSRSNTRRSRARLTLEQLEDRLTPSPVLVVTSEPPGSVPAGTPFGLAVTAEDGCGNALTSFNGPVTIDDFGVIGTPTVHAVNGVATFTNVRVTDAGNQMLYAAAIGFFSENSTPIDVTPLAATQFRVVGPDGYSDPFNVAENRTFVAEVIAEDPYGNVDPTFDGAVTIALANAAPGALLRGVLTETASAGVASFSGLSVNKTGQYSIRASTVSLTAGVSSPFDVTYQIVMTSPPPSTVTAGAPLHLVAKIEDGRGNTITSFNGSVMASAYLFGAIGLGTNLLSQTTVQAVDGVATFAGLSYTEAAEQISPADLSADSLGLASAMTSIVVIAPSATQKVE